jgi:predicted PurR-regulated permease PerM
MNEKQSLSPQEQQELSRLEQRAQRSRLAWERAKLSFISVTPKDWTRLVLLVGITAVIARIIWVAWDTLIPFFVGGIIAYLLLPLVNRLDRFMPRIIAVILTLTAVTLFIVTFLNFAIPPIVAQIYRGYQAIPNINDLRETLSQFDEYLRTYPQPIQQFVDQLAARLIATGRENLDEYVNRAINLSVNTIFGLFNTISFILGLFIIPAWLLTILVDQRKARQSLNQLLPTWLRADFWAIIRIIDRTFSSFLRGQMLLGLIVGLGFYFALWLMPQLGLPEARYKILLAIFVGITQLIPSIGPFLGAVPLVIIGINEPQLGILLFATFVALQIFINQFIAPSIERRIYDIHPGIMIIIIVALSTFGWWWVILAAPVIGIVHDLTRYILGRLQTPPRPAGVLPKEKYVVKATTQPATSPPTNYRRRLRQTPRR